MNPVRVAGDPLAPRHQWFRACALAQDEVHHINRDVNYVPPEVATRGPA